MRTTYAIILSILLPSALSAQWQTIGDLDSSTTDGPSGIVLHAGHGILSARVLTPGLIRVRYAPEGRFSPDFSWAVIATTWPPVKAERIETPTTITLGTPELTLLVNKRPVRLSFRNAAGEIIAPDDPVKGMSNAGTEVRAWKTMPTDEFYYGFGEKAGSLEKSWKGMTMWNSDIPGYAADTDPLYESIPFFYGIRKGRAYGIFLDNSFRPSFDMGKESGTSYAFGAEAGGLNYYAMAGPSPAEVLARFTGLVGRMPLPPRWALGYQQCRWSYPTERRVREIAAGFRQRKIPCDVIYLDIDYMNGYRIFTWNRNNFPDPARMITDLRRDGFRIAVIVDPGIKVDTAYEAYRSGLAGGCFVRKPDGSLYTGKVWPGVCAFPDFTSAAARTWWGEQFAGLAKAGVRGWWNDMNEPSVFDVPTHTIDLDVLHDENGHGATHAKEHNVYGMEMTRATYDGVRSLLPDERPFVLTRASFAGGQRYSAAWTGDNVASWQHLAMAVPMCLNLSISGQPFVGTDIGGFNGYPSGELFARWLQLGVFTPLMRAHSVIGEKNKEPWEYGDEFTAINRETIALRYRLLPYIYTAMEEASATGIPPMRPMIFVHPDDDRFKFEQSEFEFGDDLLIAPVLEEGARTREVALPHGPWYNYWTGERYRGGGSVVVPAPLNRIPIFVRGGAIVPEQQPVQYSDQAPIDPLTLNVFAADSNITSSSRYYEDDGTTFQYLSGSFLRRILSQNISGNEARIGLTACEGSYVFPSRSLLLRIVGLGKTTKSVQLNGTPVAKVRNAAGKDGESVWWEDAGVIWIKTQDSRAALDAEIRFQ